MKRGFLLKAAAKKRGLSDERDDQGLQQSEPKDTQINVQDIKSKIQLPTSREDLPSKYRLPFGHLTDQEKALPDDYDKSNPSLVVSPQGTNYKTIPHINDGDGSTEWIISDTKAEAKLMNTPGYPSRKPKPRRPDLYEVRVTRNMGQGVFAKHNIKRGELVFSERPLLVAPNWIATANTNKFTLAQSRQIMMYEHEKVLGPAVQRMSETDKALYTALYNSHTTDGTGPLLGIMRTNAFSASELSDDDEDGVLHYSAVCNHGSRLNHSCKPNVIFMFNIPSFSFQFVAVRDIKPGDELYCAYCKLTRTKAERQADLAPYGFSCQCSACVNATPATDNIRKTFKDQVSHLDTIRKQPEMMADAVASAKRLEAEMDAEGLDITFDFFTLLCVIQVTSYKLGRWAEKGRCEQRIKEYCKIHIHERPSLQQFLIS